MSRRQTIRANVKWLAAAHLAVKPIWFVFLLLSTRLLGAEEFGRTMLAISFVSIIAVMLEGGLDIHVVRALSAAPENYHRLLTHSGLLRIASGLLVGVVAAGLLFVPGVAPVGRALLLPAILYSLFNTAMLHARTVFRSFEIMQFEALSIVVEKLAVMALCVLALLAHPSAEFFLPAYAAAYGVACLATLILVARAAGWPRARIEPAYLWKGVLRPALPFAFMNLFAIIYFRSGTLILSWVTGREDLVGYFNAGYRLVESYMLFPTIITAPIYPVLARRFGEGDALSPLLLKAARAILCVSLLITGPLFVFREGFTRLLFGGGYAAAATSVGVVCLAMIPVGMNFVFGSLVAASGRQPRGNVFIVLVTLFNVAANFVLIPRVGVVGAAAVTVLTELFLAVANLWVVRDFVRWREFGGLLGRLALAAALGTGAGLAGLHFLPFIAGAALMTLVFAAACVALRLVTREDVAALLSFRKPA